MNAPGLSQNSASFAGDAAIGATVFWPWLLLIELFVMGALSEHTANCEWPRKEFFKGQTSK